MMRLSLATTVAALCPSLSRSFLLQAGGVLRRPCSATNRRMTVKMSSSSSSSTSNRPVISSDSSSDARVHIYPFGTLESELLLENNNDSKNYLKYSHTKVLHFIRHAQGHHNVNQEYRHIKNLDARLTERGQQQCRDLASSIRQAATTMTLEENNSSSPLHSVLHNTELIVTSPLTRCMQTALLSFEPVLLKRKVPLVAHESIRETVNYSCDRRRPVSVLKQEFPHVDFTHLQHEHDAIWNAYEERLGSSAQHTRHRESAELHVVADRGRDFFQWLEGRKERHVVVCSHAAFSRCLWNFGLDEKVPLEPEQFLDTRHVDSNDDDDDAKTRNVPVVQYKHTHGDDAVESFANSLRRDYDNCELRSMVIAFPSK